MPASVQASGQDFTLLSQTHQQVVGQLALLRQFLWHHCMSLDINVRTQWISLASSKPRCDVVLSFGLVMFPKSVQLDFMYPEVRLDSSSLSILGALHLAFHYVPLLLHDRDGFGQHLLQVSRFRERSVGQDHSHRPQHGMWSQLQDISDLVSRQVQNPHKMGTSCRLASSTRHQKDPMPFEDKLLVAMFSLSISMAPSFSRYFWTLIPWSQDLHLLLRQEGVDALPIFSCWWGEQWSAGPLQPSFWFMALAAVAVRAPKT